MLNRSSNKMPCENYLFEDYRSKSGIRSWILALAISGRSPRFPKKISSSCQIYRFHKVRRQVNGKCRWFRLEKEYTDWNREELSFTRWSELVTLHLFLFKLSNELYVRQLCLLIFYEPVFYFPLPKVRTVPTIPPWISLSGPQLARWDCQCIRTLCFPWRWCFADSQSWGPAGFSELYHSRRLQ